MPPTWSMCACVSTRRAARAGRKASTAAANGSHCDAHHERVDDGEAVVVGDHARVADARLAARLQPDPHAVGRARASVSIGPRFDATAGYRYSDHVGAHPQPPRRTCLPSPARARRCSPRPPGSAPTWSSSTSRTPSRRSRRRPRATQIVQAINDQDWGDTVLCVRVNAWDTEWTYRDVIHVVEDASERLDEIMLPKVQSASEVQSRSTCCSPRSSRRPGRAVDGRHRGADRDGARPHQRRGDLRGVAAARDDHLRSGRLRGVDRDAGAHRRRADPRVPGRPLPLRVLQDPHGRPGQRAPGDRRPVPEDQRARRAARLRDAHPHPRLRRQVGAAPRPGRGDQRGVHAHPGAVRPRLRHPRGLREGHDRRRPAAAR